MGLQKAVRIEAGHEVWPNSGAVPGGLGGVGALFSAGETHWLFHDCLLGGWGGGGLLLFCPDGVGKKGQRGCGGGGEGRFGACFERGLGAHINSGDSDGGRLTPTAYMQSLHRERSEELVGPGEVATTFFGWINDDSDPVGQVHLGAVHLGQVDERDSLRIREYGEDIHAQGWWRSEEIKAQQEYFEKWSILAVELVLSCK